MDLELKGKAVVVLASSKGLGKASAREFALEGAKVMLCGRNQEVLEKAAKEIETESGSPVFWEVCEVSNQEDIEALMEAAMDKMGRIDVLVNNAGGPPAGKFVDMKDNDWQQAFELTLFSFVRAIRAALPELKKNEGRIVNIASSSVKEPLDSLILSNTFRMGIAGLSKSLARELAPDGVLVNTIGPGRIATDRTKDLDEKRAEKNGVSFEKARQEAESMIPIGRYGAPEEFAKQVVFLGSFANTYVTGQTLLVEGGLVKAY
ncbi:3-oxoacyl-[acyl-carrier protein] reductase [Alteribacillus persepolensis]|uniref:3-oxoacyl-[acyl-carrier protein] reductase n=1 Tax=Alteribacillus persepolensis TaxID=568899 RepID=A0A1G8AHD3_9BACI|nr:SDR family oxidoreductase [Alteribacillus persepolensis]SDH20256.1 3-oxoacyl-[acyl-carrier protein] reductase [Alteribacillus persepolensis]